MEIIHKSDDKVKFGKLVGGDVFKDECSNYCMKISYSDKANMVYISDGLMDYMSDDEIVIKVKCKLVVDN